ncbi:DNA mismatch repair protein Mlh1 isoform X2 [Cimex lectularius]|uniref:DNA mismatch repair protein MLH1 n=1 Tax=Cimex lectularius TaxID=79782 RepID=A0A8I6RRA3_CIMLE|nr:DNA mismatch repair protein Mlh1 isoform X2 [Cimex lectularius]
MGEPGVIKKLDETVVNRIAAGEVIQRPANALKELLENSLDAKATNIQVTLKEGGLKLLQIMDNGSGIRSEDLEIVCERFTTSKLREFEDLSSIATFGFRGEALASISHVAHLTITTKTASQKCAYKASYCDGRLKEKPKLCAGNQGTLIVVEDLFYNVATRKKSLKNASEEHAKVVEVVSRYAIHNPSVGFSLKKQGEPTADVRTNPNSTHIDNIRTIFGNNIARELLEITETDDVLKFKLHGYITNVNFSTKKHTHFILFINNRLVNSTALKRTLEDLYTLYLPKGSHPFIYLSISLDPKNVDVNVHPTKHEVHFLHEDAVIESTKQAIEKKLLGSNTSRVFYTQAKLPEVDLDLNSAVLEETISNVENNLNKTEKVHAKNLVRTDSTSQKIEKFLTSQSESQTQEEKSAEPKKPIISKQETKLTSVLTLRRIIEDECNLALRDIVANLTFVGCVDPDRALIQSSTELYLFNTRRLKEELFYQMMLYDFGNIGAIKFQTPLPLTELAMIGLEDPISCWKEEDGDKSMIADSVTNLLIDKREMLIDYFSIEIDRDKNLCTIPLILDDYKPDVSRLPHFVLRLACDVDWTSEQNCFDTICRETAKFFSYTDCFENDDNEWRKTIEHVVYPAIKKTLLPPKKFAEDKTILQLASLPDLYKVFERC